MVLIQVVIVAVLVAPAPILWFRWRARSRMPGTEGLGRWLLAVGTVSWLWLMGLLLWPDLFGPHYSDRRFRTINVNAAVVAVAIALALVRRGTRRDAAALVPVLVGWLYTGVISSVA